MATLIVLAFVVGYFLIAMEHSVKIDKAASALFTGVTCWLVLTIGLENMPVFGSLAAGPQGPDHFLEHSLAEHLGKISEILFFLLGAMTIVELMDAHDGFLVVTERIKTANRVKLLWVLCWLTFFLSAVLDNLTTAIVMCALLRRILKDVREMWFFGGFVVIAANAGGAWSPIGDVTTIMLWIGGQVTTLNIIKTTFLASVAALLLPLLLATYQMRREKSTLERVGDEEGTSAQRTPVKPYEQRLVFGLGAFALLSVPVFKALTHMPPYMGILLSLGILWFVTDLLHLRKSPEAKKEFSVASTLRRIDTPSILFFLGILLAVGALETSGHLKLAAQWLDSSLGNIYQINILIGLFSAVVDNVPLVAACMGMYDLSTFPPDHEFWELLAFCAGTGGSILIIGSAAGVAAMSVLNINFMWYLRRIAPFALLGYFAGIAVYWAENHLFRSIFH
jgi:Na+/H+ antiporter NhaD/arsenite permease-like protein